MRINVRKAGVACCTVFASASLALSIAAPSWAASSALVIGGISTPSLSDTLMSPLLGGALKNQQRVSVNWPAQAGPMTGKNDLTLGASIKQGQTNLNAQISAALGRLGKDANGNYVKGEKVTVVGLSAGSLVVNEVLRQLAADANAPGKDQITFIVVADSSRQSIIDDNAKYNKNFDYTYRPAPETKYDVVVVTGEYDGMADFPDRWWNVLAVTNAIAGGIFVHVPVMYADLSKVPAQNIDVDVNSKGGTTTHYLVPTEKLPLVRMFPSLAAREAELKAKIDKGYSRNDVPVGALRTLVAAAPAAVAPVVVSAVAETKVAAVSAPVATQAVTANPVKIQKAPASAVAAATPARVEQVTDDAADDTAKAVDIDEDSADDIDRDITDAAADAETTSTDESGTDVDEAPTAADTADNGSESPGSDESTSSSTNESGSSDSSGSTE